MGVWDTQCAWLNLSARLHQWSSCTCNSGISLVCLDGGTVPKGVKSSDNVIGAVAHLLKKIKLTEAESENEERAN